MLVGWQGGGVVLPQEVPSGPWPRGGRGTPYLYSSLVNPGGKSKGRGHRNRRVNQGKCVITL